MSGKPEPEKEEQQQVAFKYPECKKGEYHVG